MPDRKISDLTDGGAPQDPDEFVVARGGDNFKLDWASMSAEAASGQIQITASGNTAGVLAGISSGTLTLAGGNNITLSQVGNAVTISGANAGGAQTGISGLANSETTYTSGTVSLSELGALTIRSSAGQIYQFEVPATSSLSATGIVELSTNGSTISIGASQSVQPETQTFIGGISASDTLYTSGSVRISGSNAATVKSGTGQLVIIDVPVQSTQPETQTFIAGISASDTLYTSGNVRITGVGGGVTISSNTGQRIDISVAAQSVQPETQTFIAGVSASDTLYTSGNVRITGVGGGITVSSNTGQRIDLSVAAQSVQPETQTFIGGISASNTLYTSGSVRFTGSQAVTVRSGTGQLVVIDAPAQTAQTGISGIANSQTTYTSGTVSLSELGAITIRSTTGNQFQLSVAAQSAQTGISGIANSQTTYTSGTVSLSELGAITIRSTTGNQYQLSVNSQTAQTQGILAVGASTGGNTAGDTGVASGTRLVFVGSNNITVSQGTAANATTLTISGPTTAAQTVQTQGILNVALSNIGNTAGDTGIGSGTRYVLAGGNGITLSGSSAANATTVTISGITQSVQTQGGFASLGVSTGGNTAGNTQVSTGSRFVLVGTNMVSLSQATAAGASTVTIDATNQNLSVGASTGGGTAGNTTVNTGSRLVFAGGNNITVSQGTAAGATTITISAPNAAAAQTGISGIANSQTTYTSGTVSLSELGAITIRSTTGNQYQLSVNSQTVQTQNMVAVSATNTLYSSGTVLFTGSNMVTVKSSGAGQTIILDATQSVQTQGILNVALSNIGNTAGDTGINSGTRLVLAGGNNITLSASTAANATTLTISAPNLGAGAMSAGVSTGGNTAGATGITGTQLVLVGTNMISLSQTTGANGGTVSINATQSVQTQGVPLMGVSTGGATSGDTTVNSGTRFVLVGTNLTMSQGTAANATTVTVSAPATSSLSGTGGIQISTNGSTISLGFKPNINDWENMASPLATLLTHVSGNSKQAFFWNDEIPGNLTAKSLALKISMVTASQPLSVSVHLGVYTFVNSTSAALLGSHSEAFVVSSATSVSLSGIRHLIMTGIGTHATLSTLSYGEYGLGLMFSATATNAMNFSLMGANSAGGALGGLYPGTNNVSAGTSQGVQALFGRLSTTVNAMPNNYVASDLINYGQGASMQLHPWIYIRS